MRKQAVQAVLLGRTVREVMTAWSDRARDVGLTVTAQYLPGPKHELLISAAGKPELTIREEAGGFIGNRPATGAEADEFYDALQKGQVEIVALHRLSGAREVLHARTFEPLLTEDQLHAYTADSECQP